MDKQEQPSSGPNEFFKQRNLEFFRERCQMLENGTHQQQLESATYIRRILAAGTVNLFHVVLPSNFCSYLLCNVGKTPPLDLLLECPFVVPSLIPKLTLFEFPSLQFEAAWCITNIACGDQKYIAMLVDHGAVHNLCITISQHANLQLMQQSLWALCNMSNDEYACRAINQHPACMLLVLYHIGIKCFPHPEVQAVDSWSDYDYSFVPEHWTMNENPALGSLRHATFLLGNVLKLRQPVHASLYRCIFFAFCDLLHSPDDEIILDISQTLAIACLGQPFQIQTAMEEGLLLRLKELLDMSMHQEMALVAICSMLRSPWVYHRRICLLRLQWDENSNKLPLVPRLLFSLRDASNVTTKRDIIAAIKSVLELKVVPQEQTFAEQYLFFGILPILAQLIETGSFDVKLDAGGLLLMLLQITNFMRFEAEVFQSLANLFTCTDPEVALLSLQASEQILLRLITLSLGMEVGSLLHILSSAVDLVMMHPLTEIATQASRVRQYLDHIQRMMIGEDDVNIDIIDE